MLSETNFIFNLFESNLVFMLFALLLFGNSPKIKSKSHSEMSKSFQNVILALKNTF